MKHLHIFIAMLLFSAPCGVLAIGPYDGPPESKSGPGVEEIWTDQGVRYYRGLRGTPNTSRPREAGVMPYQPEIEFGAAQPLKAPAAKKSTRRTVRKAPAVRKASSTKVASTSRKKVRRTKRAARPVAQAVRKPVPPATQLRDAEPPIPYGTDPFSGGGIVGTTRLQ